ncbi:Tn3 family transposase [Variovorax paradoxus]|nr:Tn3 family transposase [Variovorax paradoxus]
MRLHRDRGVQARDPHIAESRRVCSSSAGAIYYGKISHERGRRRDEMKVISGSHALLTNIVLAWNTAQMQGVVDRLRKEGQIIEDSWLRRIGPVHFGHINFRGMFRFPVERYAEALPQRSTTASRRSA